MNEESSLILIEIKPDPPDPLVSSVMIPRGSTIFCILIFKPCGLECKLFVGDIIPQTSPFKFRLRPIDHHVFLIMVLIMSPNN
jgi:hypothetical protein